MVQSLNAAKSPDGGGGLAAGTVTGAGTGGRVVGGSTGGGNGTGAVRVVEEGVTTTDGFWVSAVESVNPNVVMMVLAAMPARTSNHRRMMVLLVRVRDLASFRVGL